METNRNVSVFQSFIEKNGLKKKDVADYLGVSAAFVTQIAQGQRDLPSDKLALIKANSIWDTTMFEGCRKDMVKNKAESEEDFPELIKRFVAEGKLIPVSLLEQRNEEIRTLNRQIGRLEEKLLMVKRIIESDNFSNAIANEVGL